MIVALYKAIGLRVVWSGPNALNAQQTIDLLHSLGEERSALVCEDLLWDSHPGEQLQQRLRYWTCRDFAQREGLWVTRCIVTYYQNVSVAGLRSLQGPYNVHRYASKGHLNDWKWLKRVRACLPFACQLTFRAGLTVIQYLTVEPWPIKPGCNSLMALGVA